LFGHPPSTMNAVSDTICEVGERFLEITISSTIKLITRFF
jgi:hypothetical protein